MNNFINEFELDFEGHLLRGDNYGDRLSKRTLMLHGAGQANRGKMLPLRKELFGAQIGSCSFDFIGHGETGGDLRTTTLNNRTAQALAVIKNQGLTLGPLSIIAASMSAHTAVQLTKFCKVESLILVVPAMYACAAYDVKFGPDFSKIIRVPNSWKDSDGWDQLSEFKGDLLVIAAGQDKVIPRGVVRRYFDCAKNASLCRTYTIQDAGHMVFSELRENNPAEMEKVRDMMIDLLL